MTATIPVNEKWLAGTGKSLAEAEQEFRCLLAAKLYELRRLTLAQAADMAGMNIWSFMDSLSKAGVSVMNLSAEDLTHDIAHA